MKKVARRLVLAIALLALIAVIGIWLRSERIKYDMAWFWIRPDCRICLNSHQGTIHAYAESEELSNPADAGWKKGDDYFGWWSLETNSPSVQWDYPVFDGKTFPGISFGSEAFLADSPTIRTGCSISYWLIILIITLPICLVYCWRLRSKKGPASSLGETQ